MNWHVASRRYLTATILLMVGAMSLAAAGWPIGATAASADDTPLVLVAPLEGAIDPASADFVERVLDEAQERDASAVVLTMDTPGGLSSSMDAIVKQIVNARSMPVVVYVSPSGARAGSAGAFITMASDVAAMAPGTTIGSATPINSSGDDIGGDLRKKVVNDAASKMRTLARERGRNAELAERFVREAENVTADEALEQDVIEYVASDLDDLLDDAHGTRIEPKDIELRTEDAVVERVEVPLTLRLLKILIDPNLLFLLFSGGLLGLAFELTHPGSVVPGVAGVILLLLALYGLQVLPTTGAGIGFLLLAVALFAGEALFASSGVLGGGGAVSLFLGGLLLFENGSGYAIDVWLLVVVSVVLGMLLYFVARKALQASRSEVRTGAEFLVGERGRVRRPLDPQGTVFVQGELWQARSSTGALIGADVEVVVRRVNGMELEVEVAPPQTAADVAAGDAPE